MEAFDRYVYDNTALTDLLVRRLSNQRDPLEAVVLVDREQYLERTTRGERPSLDRLQRANAEVLLCRGTPPLGAFHLKALVADRRTAFVGSANLTNKSFSNTELLLRLRGPPVADVLKTLDTARRRGVSTLDV